MAGRLYTKTHEWLSADGKSVTVGITDFAQAQLGDVVFLELPNPGRKLEAGESFGVVESVKAASDLYAPVAGRVTEVNDKLAAKPELINSDPYGDGWILKLELSGEMPKDTMDEAAYKAFAEPQA
ncbi:MAG TPA: glycine cleavage system protein GcvH [Candidatus Dormibacteraeota bacterium]|nr:glycine cleavage system protein GcvH [Candidatus Dormibacteraeota bacterium]